MRRRESVSLAFCPVLADMIKANSASGRTGKLLDLGSLSTSNNLATLRQLHLAWEAMHTLEIGFACGGSALVFTQTHKDLGSPPNHQHVAIDPYQRSHWIDESGLVAVERAKLDGYLHFIEDVSSYALPELVKRGDKFDLIYIDGSHLFEDVFVDFYYAARLLADGGLIIFDDCTNPHVRKVLRYIKRSFPISLPEFDLFTYRYNVAYYHYSLARAFGRLQMKAFRRVNDPVREWNSAFRNF